MEKFSPKFIASLLVVSFLISPLSVFAEDDLPADIPSESVSEPIAEPIESPIEDQSPSDDPNFDPFSFPEATPEELSEESEPLLETEEQKSEEEGEGEEPPALLGGEEEEPTEIKVKPLTERLPNVSEADGSLTYEYPIIIPPGRNGLQPDLSLIYSSRPQGEENIFSYGWDVNIPYIERLNKQGTQKLYTEYDFTSSIDGELIAISSSSYKPRVENGQFHNYVFSASQSWSFIDKNGISWKFGETASSQQANPGDSSKIYKWMLSEIRDTNDNYIKYEYYENKGQIYPWKITYTGNGSTDGIFQVEFVRKTRTDEILSYSMGFAATTSYTIDEILARINGNWARRYKLGYTTGSNNRRTLLSEIGESGRTEAGVIATLPSISFEYESPDSTSMWASSSYWHPPVRMSESMVIDVNGDGYPDILHSYDKISDDKNTIYINNTINGFTEDASSSYVAPIYLFSENPLVSNPVDTGYRFADIDGDGLVDITGVNAWRNTGTGWTSAANWGSPQKFVYDGSGNADEDTAQLADLNGDGLPDVVRCYETGGSIDSKIYFNNGTSFSYQGNWSCPVSTAKGTYFADINGDGLADIIKGADGDQNTYLNNGVNGWNKNTSYGPPETIHDNGIRLADINGDNLPDFVKRWEGIQPPASKNYINAGFGCCNQGSSGWDPPVPFRYQNNAATDTGSRLVDINGDGMVDAIRSWISGDLSTTVQLNTKKKADLLRKINYVEGGSSSVRYKPSSRYKDSNNVLLNPDLPFILDTVASISNFDGLSSISFVNQYEVGSHYYSNPFDRKVAGFGKVTKTDGASNQTITYFHQGNTSSSAWSEANDHFAKIAKPFRTEVFDKNNNLYKRNWNTWLRIDLGSSRSFVVLASTQEQLYDGNSTHRDKGTTYAYNSSNGNLTEQIEWGEITRSSASAGFTDTGSDKFTTTFSYAASGSMFFPSVITKNNQSSVKVSETKNYYDDQTIGLVYDGNLTKQERWASASSYIDIEKVYNRFGLVVREKDPRDKVASFSYDIFSMYATKSANALGHITKRTFDYSSGKVRQLIDPNDLTFENVYDGLDRIIEEKQPDISGGGEGFMFGGGGGESMFGGFGSQASISSLLEGLTPGEKAVIKSQAIASLGSIEKTERSDYFIEVVAMNPVDTGVEVFARAWDKNNVQIGFGSDGSVDIERFRIFNPPILVPDEDGDIIRSWKDQETEEEKEVKLSEDLPEALLQILEHTISVKAEKFGPQNIIPGKIGNTTTIVYPNAGDPGSSSVDGVIQGSDTTWSTVRSASSGDDGAASTDNVNGPTAELVSTIYYIRRIFLLFDTSGITDGDTISTTTLSIVGESSNTNQNQFIDVVAATPASNTTLIAGDYDQVGSTVFGSKSLSLFDVGDVNYNNISLNASGLANVSTTGVSKFALRGSLDTNNSTPTNISYLQHYLADESGTTIDPKLTIEHSTGAPAVTDETRNIYVYTNVVGAMKVQKKEYLDGTDFIDTQIYFDGLGRKLQERREAEGLNYSVRDFKYNSRGMLGKETVPYFSAGSTKTTATTTENLYASHSYDALSRLSKIDNAIGSVSYSHDNWKVVVKDARGNNKHLFNDAYDNLVRVDEINTGASYSTNYEYNGNNNLTKITDALGNVRNFTYDGLGRRLRAQDLHDPSDATFGTWIFTYDLSGNVASHSDPKGQIVNYTYDDINRVLTENFTGQSGTEVTYTYDSCINGKGHLCSVLSPGASSSYRYMVLGQKSRERTKIGSTTYQTDYTYNRQEFPLTITNPDSSEVKYAYNAAGQLETIQRKESGGSYEDVITDFNYVPHGKIASQSFANCVLTTNTYDQNKLYRLSNIFTDLDECEESLMGGGGDSFTMLPNSDERGTKSFNQWLEEQLPEYRATLKGQEIAKIASISRTTIGDYDIEVVAMEAILDGIQVFARAWDKSGNQIGFGIDGTVDIERFIIINPPILVPDLYGTIVRSWKDQETDEDKHRNLKEDLEAALLQSLEHTISVKDEKFGPENIIPGKIGNTTTTVYPNAGTGSTTVDGQVQGSDTTWATVRGMSSGDDGASPSETVDGPTAEKVSTIYFIRRAFLLFDTSAIADSDSITSVTLSVVGESSNTNEDQDIDVVASTPASNNNLVAGDFDQLGATVFGSKVLSTFDVGDVNYNNIALDSNGRANVSKTGVSKFGLRGSLDTDNTTPIAISYLQHYFADISGTTQDPKLTIEHSAAAEVLQDITYTYDKNNNITRIVDDSSTARVASYSYDALNRLKVAQLSSISAPYVHTFGYDALGNITSKSDEGIYTYATQSFGGAYANPHAVYNISRIASFSYDANGNLTNVASSSVNIATASWDYKNRMSRFKSSTASHSYAYDHTGQRTSVNNDTTITHYPTKFYNYDGTTRIKHIFTPDGLLVAMVKGTAASISLHYIHNDHLGGTNVVTDEDGALESLNDYHAFGENRINTGSPSEQRKYTGHEFDSDTGLNYMNARYQSGRWGRFISQDPLYLIIGDQKFKESFSSNWRFDKKSIGKSELKQFLSNPQQLNSYGYALNNPLKYTDPTGEIPVAIPFIILAYGVLSAGIDAYTFKTVMIDYPRIFSREDKIEATGELVLDVITPGIGKIIPKKAEDFFEAAEFILDAAKLLQRRNGNGNREPDSSKLISPTITKNNLYQSLIPRGGFVGRSLTIEGVCCKTSTLYERLISTEVKN